MLTSVEGVKLLYNYNYDYDDDDNNINILIFNKKLIVAQLFKNFLIFYGTRKLITTYIAVFATGPNTTNAQPELYLMFTFLHMWNLLRKHCYREKVHLENFVALQVLSTPPQYEKILFDMNYESV